MTRSERIHIEFDPPFVAPMLVLATCFLAKASLDLSFGQAEVGSLFPGVIPGTLAANGQSNGQKGLHLVTVYSIMP